MADTDTFDALNYQYEIDELAAMAGVSLRIEHDDAAPMPWAVWSDDGEGGGDIVGAGDTVSEAIEDARRQARQWEAKRVWSRANEDAKAAAERARR